MIAITKKFILMTYVIGTLVLSIMMMPVSHAETTVIKYIKNSYTVGAYLFDDGGFLRYGIPLENEEAFQWMFTETDDGILIQNVGTTRYITLKNHNNTPQDTVKVLPFDDTDDSFYWQLDLSLESNISQNIVNLSPNKNGVILHLEGASNGHVMAEQVDGQMLSWGNTRWQLYDESSINFAAIIRDGFIIQNAFSNEFLYVDNLNKISIGTPSEPDDAYIWEITANDNLKQFKNKKNQKYLNDINDFGSNDPVGFTSYVGYSNYILTDAINGLYQDNDEISIENLIVNPRIQGTWHILPATYVDGMVGDLVMNDQSYNLKNAWFELYLVVYQGEVTYGNVNPQDHNAKWQFLYDEVTGKTALKNQGTNTYLVAGEGPNGLEMVSTLTYYWKLNRNKNDQYPESVVFQDGVNPTWYLHMENLNGYPENSNAVQPSWGTPHWTPILPGSNPIELSSYTPSSNYVRIQSQSNPETYLYQTASGGLAYGSVAEGDARSHFAFEKTNENNYYIKNREYQTYLKNMGNGVIKAFDTKEEVNEGGRWIVEGISTGGYLIKNYHPNNPSFQFSLLNMSQQTGLASSTIVSIESRMSQWNFTTAPDVTDLDQSGQTKHVKLNSLVYERKFEVYHQNQSLGQFELNAYGALVQAKKTGSNEYLKIQNQNVDLAPMTVLFDTEYLFEFKEVLGEYVLVKNDLKLILKPIEETITLSKADGHLQNGYYFYSVYVKQGGSHELTIASNGLANTYQILVNGIEVDNQVTKFDTVILNLNQGANQIGITALNDFQSISISDMIPDLMYGFDPIYETYEAEHMDTNGEILYPSSSYRTIESESSGRSAVVLDKTARYVKFKLNQDMNALMLRYSIPDTNDGVGQDTTLNVYVDNVLKGTIDTSSKKTHLYGAFPWSNNPSEGLLHVYYDESMITFDEIIPKGTEIKLQKDVSNFSTSYTIDLVETYMIDEALDMPLGAVNILDHGAIANDSLSDDDALEEAVLAARNGNGIVYIPEGQFDFTETFEIKYNFIRIIGAGKFYTTLNNLNILIGANHVGIYHLHLEGSANTRRDEIDRAAVEMKGDGFTGLSLVDLYVKHYKVGFWLSYVDHLFIAGNTIRYTYADGINLHRGVENARLIHNDFQSTGDDSIGLWSEVFSNNKVIIEHNRIRNPWLANGIAIYGGKNHTVRNNDIRDTVYASAGINVSTNFQPTMFTGYVDIYQNRLESTGSTEGDEFRGAIWFNSVLGYDNRSVVTIKDNVLVDNVFQGISFSGSGYVSNVRLESNTIRGTGTYGVEIASTVSGNVLLKNNLYQGINLEEVLNDSMSVLLVTHMEYYQADLFWNDLRMGLTIGALSLVLLTDFFLGFLITRKIIKFKKGVKSHEEII